MANRMGWLGWFSLAGFVILGALYIIDVAEISSWPVSPTWTLIIAIIAGIGAALLYFGDDPTAPDAEAEVTRTS